MKTDEQILKDFIARMSNGEKSFIHQVVIGHKALVMTGPELQVAFEKAVQKSTAFTIYKNNIKIDEIRA